MTNFLIAVIGIPLALISVVTLALIVWTWVATFERFSQEPPMTEEQKIRAFRKKLIAMEQREWLRRYEEPHS